MLVGRGVRVMVGVSVGQGVRVLVGLLVGVLDAVGVSDGAGVGGSPVMVNMPATFQFRPTKIWTS